MLYSDPACSAEKILYDGASAPDAEVTDEYGVVHKVWRVSDPASIRLLTTAMADKKLIIADGHHRYETALNYSKERAPSQPPAETETATGQLPRPPYPEAAEAYFAVTKLPEGDATTLIATLKTESGVAFVAATGSGDYLLRAKPDAATTTLAELPAPQRQLDLSYLHTILLDHILGLDAEKVREQTNIRYLRDASEAVDQVRRGEANVTFLTNPVTMEQLREVAFAGSVMPQKSTDFYPKLLSGLTIYALE